MAGGRKATLRSAARGEDGSVKMKGLVEIDHDALAPAVHEDLTAAASWGGSVQRKRRAGRTYFCSEGRALDYKSELEKMEAALADGKQGMPSDAWKQKTKKTVATTAFNPAHLKVALSTWDENMLALISGIQIGTLMQAPSWGQIDRAFGMLLLYCLDTSVMKVDLGEGVQFDVDQDMIRRMGSFKKGSKLIGVKKGVDRRGQLKVLHALLGTGAISGSITINQLVKVLEDATPADLETEEGKKKLKVAYTMLAFCSFLAPKNESSIVAPEILDLACDIDSIDEYDFVPYILDIIHQGALKVQGGLRNPPRKLDVDGCLVFLQIAFLDHVYHGKKLSKKLATPRIRYYSKSRLKAGLREHGKKHVKYPFKDGFVEEAAQFAMLANTTEESMYGHAELLNSTGVAFSEPQMAVLSKIFNQSLEAKETEFKAMLGSEQFGYLAFCQELDKLKGRKYLEMTQRLERYVLISRRELVDDCMSKAKRLKLPVLGETSAQQERVLVGVPVLEGLVLDGRVLPVTEAMDSTPGLYEMSTPGLATKGISVAGNATDVIPGPQPGTDATEEAFIEQDVRDHTGPLDGMVPVVSGIAVGGCAGGDHPPIFDLPARFDRTPVPSSSAKKTSITEQTTHRGAPMDSAEAEAAKTIMDMASFLFPIKASVPGKSPFELGLCHRKTDTGAANKFRATLMAASDTDLQRTWFKHLVPSDLELNGYSLKMMFGGDGCWGNDEMDAATRLFAEMDAEMMAGIDVPRWRHVVSPFFSANVSAIADGTSVEGFIDMFKGCKYEYDVNSCRMIMCPVPLDSAWCLYVFDQVKKILSVLDPMYTDKSPERYRMKHYSTISRLSVALKNVGNFIGNAWEIDPNAWQTKYNIKMHPRCQHRTLTGSYVLHYARQFDGEDLLAVPTQVVLEAINESIVHGIAGMKGNLATNPSFHGF